MLEQQLITAIIPALNEDASVAQVVHDLYCLEFNGQRLVDRVVVCDNGSVDQTARQAEQAGAYVVVEPRRGYGAACLAAVGFIQQSQDLFTTDIVLFLNADQSEDASEAIKLLLPIARQQCDLVVGSRHISLRDEGALSRSQRFGNWLVSGLVSLTWANSCTDFGPFRAIAYQKLIALQMQDRNFGWTVEMQVKALHQKMRVVEVPVSAKVGITASRVTGTWRGSVLAAIKMLGWVFYIGSLRVLSVSQLTRRLNN